MRAGNFRLPASPVQVIIVYECRASHHLAKPCLTVADRQDQDRVVLALFGLDANSYYFASDALIGSLDAPPANRSQMRPRSKVPGLDPPQCCSASSSCLSSSSGSSSSSCSSSSGLCTPEWSAYGGTYPNDQKQYQGYYHDASKIFQLDPGAPMDVSHKGETSPFSASWPMLIELPAPPPLLLPFASLALPYAVSPTLPRITFQLPSRSDPIAIAGNRMHGDDGLGKGASQTPTSASVTPTRSPLGKLLDAQTPADTADLHGNDKNTVELAWVTAGASTPLPVIPTPARRHRRGRSLSVHLLWRSNVTEEGWEVLKRHYEMKIGAPWPVWGETGCGDWSLKLERAGF